VRASAEYSRLGDVNGYLLSEANAANSLCLCEDFADAHSHIVNAFTSLGDRIEVVDLHLLLRARCLASIASYNAGLVDEAIVHLQLAISVCSDTSIIAVLFQNMGAYYNTAGEFILLRTFSWLNFQASTKLQQPITTRRCRSTSRSKTPSILPRSATTTVTLR
jgi:hypothetical protein